MGSVTNAWVEVWKVRKRIRVGSISRAKRKKQKSSTKSNQYWGWARYILSDFLGCRIRALVSFSRRSWSGPVAYPGESSTSKEGKTAWDTKTLSVREGKKEDIRLWGEVSGTTFSFYRCRCLVWVSKGSCRRNNSSCRYTVVVPWRLWVEVCKGSS